MTSCQQPYGTSTATRWPGRKSAPGAQDRTTPAASMPGVYGNATRIWYAPRVCSRSAKDTPAAATSMTTPPAADSAGSADSGSATSVHSTPSGPVDAVIL